MPELCRFIARAMDGVSYWEVEFKCYKCDGSSGRPHHLMCNAKKRERDDDKKVMTKVLKLLKTHAEARAVPPPPPPSPAPAILLLRSSVPVGCGRQRGPSVRCRGAQKNTTSTHVKRARASLRSCGSAI